MGRGFVHTFIVPGRRRGVEIAAIHILRPLEVVYRITNCCLAFQGDVSLVGYNITLSHRSTTCAVRKPNTQTMAYLLEAPIHVTGGPMPIYPGVQILVLFKMTALFE